MAIMNFHPVLWGNGITFCLPGDPRYPTLLWIFTARTVDPIKRGDDTLGRLTPQEWMERVGYTRNWSLEWPTPEMMYDYCIQFGPVLSVKMWVDEKTRMWRAMVQFTNPDDAEKLDEGSQEKLCFGWKVYVVDRLWIG